MKRSLVKYFGLILAILVAVSCTKKKVVPGLHPAVITGFDARKCACCGGLLINFQNHVNSFDGEYRLLSNQPSEFGITDSTEFPVYLKVRYVIDSSRCSGNFIKVVEFEK